MKIGSITATTLTGKKERVHADVIEQNEKITVRVTKEAITKNIKSIDFMPEMGCSQAGDSGYMVIPDKSSFLTEFHQREDTEFICTQYLMPIFGVKNSKGCFVAIVTGMPYDYELVAGAKDGMYYIYPRFVFEGEVPYEDIVVEYHWLKGEDANYSGMARRYREHQLNKGACKPIRERVKSSPALDYATKSMEVRVRMGWKPVPTPVMDQTLENEPPMHAAVTFERMGQIVEEFKRQGIEKAEFCLVGWNQKGHDGRYPQIFPVEEDLGGEQALRDLIEKAQSMGYQIVCHTNSSDAYQIADSWDEEYIIKNKDGSLRNMGESWSGGRMYHLCPEQGYTQFAKKDLPKVAELGFKGLHYIDVLTVIWPRKCYDTKHPLHRGESVAYINKTLELAKKTFGGSASEGAYDFACGNLDYALYVAFNILGKLPDMADRTIPLWQLVYHGIILSNPSAETVNYVMKDRSIALKVIEYGGRPTMYYYSKFVTEGKGRGNWMGSVDLTCDDDEQLQYGVSKLKEAYDEFKDMAHLQLQFMESHEEIAQDVYKTVYEDGSEVIINYADTPYQYGDTLIQSQDYNVVKTK